jgi:hypothetical protein
MSRNVINYKPPPTIKEFIKDFKPGELFYDWIVGPVGSGKTTGIFFKLIYMAKLQEPSSDGIRRTRAVIVRNTLPQLRDTTVNSWNMWFKEGQAGHWKLTEWKFTLRFDDVECEVLFRPLDTAEDVARVLSLEVTFAILDEFVQIPKEIVDALSARLGRYPSAKDGGATNWGMWGSSNPDNEDNWWYDYLHRNLPENARYYIQPSGFSAAAENVENLPGGAAYYTNQAKGKSEAWIKQFIDAEWGFSVSGKPVIQSFRSALHVSKRPLIYNKHLPLVVGFDPGLAGSALIFGQEDQRGRLLVLGELVQSGYGAERLISERMKPYIRQHFPEASVIVAPDPAAASRSQRDEKPVIDAFRKHFTVKIETNNRLNIRIDAIDHYACMLIEGEPALMIDERMCPILCRALKGGWRYAMDTKKDMIKTPDPEKNQYSHPGDAFGYFCRFFHRQALRDMRSTGPNNKTFSPGRQYTSAYHMR